MKGFQYLSHPPCNGISKYISLSFTKALQERIQSVKQLASTPKLQKVCIYELVISVNSFYLNTFLHFNVTEILKIRIIMLSLILFAMYKL